MTAAVEGKEVRRDLLGQEYRTSSADCAAALDAYYAAFMSFGRGRGAAILRAATADPSCALAAALAAQFVGPRDPAGAGAADNLGKATEYEGLEPLTLLGKVRGCESEYERACSDALRAGVREGRGGGARVALRGFRGLDFFGLLEEFPRDLMTLKRAQLICFYMGKPDLSLKFVEQEKAYSLDGRGADASAASEKANALQAAYFL